MIIIISTYCPGYGENLKFYIYVCTETHTPIFICIHTYTYVYTHLNVHTHVNTHMLMCTQTNMKENGLFPCTGMFALLYRCECNFDES